MQGRIQEFWKGGGGKWAKPRTERRKRERRRGVWGPHSENVDKLDANSSFNLAYIFGIRMASESKLGICRTVSGHAFETHRY